MTNGDRLRALDNAGLASEMWRFASTEYMKHVDLPAWLESEKKEYPINGKDAVVEMQNGERYTCKVIGSRTIFGSLYLELVVTADDYGYGSRILSVPGKSVTL